MGREPRPFFRILDKLWSWVRLASVLRWASDAENVSRLVNCFFLRPGVGAFQTLLGRFRLAPVREDEAIFVELPGILI